MRIQTKELTLRLKQLDENGTFEGHASTRTKDLGGDIIAPGAFKRTIDLNQGIFPILYFHDPRSPIGISDEVREDRHGLYTKGRLNLDKQLARDVHSDMKMGIVNALSIGFQTVQADYDRKLDARVIKELKLFEYSLLTRGFAMQPDALVTGVKAWNFDDAFDGKAVVPFQNLPLADRKTPWDAAAAVKRVRQWAGAEEAPNATYRKAFVWYDAANADLFGAYKLPIADVINGRLMTVPKGVYAAAAAVQGARGAAAIPAGDKAKIRAHLEKYYDRLGKTPPWKTDRSVDLDELWVTHQIVAEELKIGRRLSAASRQVIANAISALQDLMSERDVSNQGDGQDEDDDHDDEGSNEQGETEAMDGQHDEKHDEEDDGEDEEQAKHAVQLDPEALHSMLLECREAALDLKLEQFGSQSRDGGSHHGHS